MTGKRIRKDASRKKAEIKHREKSASKTQLNTFFDSWIATATLEHADEHNSDNQNRLEILSAIINELLKCMPEDAPGLLVLPGGWIDAGEQKPKDVFKRIEQAVSNQLTGTSITVCLGVDGGLICEKGQDSDGYYADQVGLVINSSGIIAAGRKFHPSPQERDYVTICKDYQSGEGDYPRNFEFNGKTGFIAVCYDSYGIRQKNLNNPGIDFVLNLVHCFYPRGEGPSGNQYFAKHGFAGASKQWNCPVFGTAVFFGRSIPPKWPTGVVWNQGSKSTLVWKYDENPLSPEERFVIPVTEGLAEVRIYYSGGLD
jgi:hypothetical protein